MLLVAVRGHSSIGEYVWCGTHLRLFSVVRDLSEVIYCGEGQMDKTEVIG